MKILSYPALFTALISLPILASAQTLPVPVEAPGQPEISNSNNTESAQATPQNDQAQALIAFFKGLDEAVAAHSENCQAMSDEISKYYDSHKPWIDSLDYATQNISQADIDEIHQIAVNFGKRLAVCHDQKSIPEILRKYAGLSGEL